MEQPSSGRKSAHCVISGHRGLPRAKLFTDLDKMEEGDQFFITVLNKRLTYEVDQIQVVEPEEVEDLAIEKGKDYVTLVTCTPYAINTHRLLVRGHRINGKGIPCEKSFLLLLLFGLFFWRVMESSADSPDENRQGTLTVTLFMRKKRLL
ncbi:MAG: sortase [Lachnospiraceae bacterium]